MLLTRTIKRRVSHWTGHLSAVELRETRHNNNNNIISLEEAGEILPKNIEKVKVRVSTNTGLFHFYVPGSLTVLLPSSEEEELLLWFSAQRQIHKN